MTDLLEALRSLKNVEKAKDELLGVARELTAAVRDLSNAVRELRRELEELREVVERVCRES